MESISSHLRINPQYHIHQENILPLALNALHTANSTCPVSQTRYPVWSPLSSDGFSTPTTPFDPTLSPFVHKAHFLTTNSLNRRSFVLLLMFKFTSPFSHLTLGLRQYLSYPHRYTHWFSAIVYTASRGETEASTQHNWLAKLDRSKTFAVTTIFFLDSAEHLAGFPKQSTNMHPRLYWRKLCFSFLTKPSLPFQWLCTDYLLLHRRPFCHLVILVNTYASTTASWKHFPETFKNRFSLFLVLLALSAPCCYSSYHTMSSLFAGTCHCSPVIAITCNWYFCPFPLCALSTHNLASSPAFTLSSGFLFVYRIQCNSKSVAGRFVLW